MNKKVKELKILLKTSLKRPHWFFYYTWYSSYNPSNNIEKRSKHIDYYNKNRIDIGNLISKFWNKSSTIERLMKEFESLKHPNRETVSPIPDYSDASWEFALLIYLIVRTKRPKKILETGVGRGLSTYYILNALKLNGSGKLYSIDMPALIEGYEKDICLYVPEYLRKNWILYKGPSLKIIKSQIGEFKNIDIFIHDSNHNYLYMKKECELGLKLLKNNGLLIADDVNNDSIFEIHKKYKSKLYSIVQEKQEPIVIIIKCI